MGGKLIFIFKPIDYYDRLVFLHVWFMDESYSEPPGWIY